MMSEADDTFLSVHLDHMQPESRLQDYVITYRSAIWLQKFKLVAKFKLCKNLANSKDAEIFFIPRLLAKGQCISRVGSKR